MTKKNSRLRLYAPDYICSCKHKMMYHRTIGCDVRGCLCKKQNLVFDNYIRNMITIATGFRGAFIHVY